MLGLVGKLNLAMEVFMTPIAPHFNREEFACKCGCGFDFVDAELVYVLLKLRNFFDSPLVINSGCRCKAYNKKIGGAERSRHTLGIAADIVVTGATPHEVHRYLNNTYPNRYGLGQYETFTHFDVRKNHARW